MPAHGLDVSGSIVAVGKDHVIVRDQDDAEWIVLLDDIAWIRAISQWLMRPILETTRAGSFMMSSSAHWPEAQQGWSSAFALARVDDRWLAGIAVVAAISTVFA